MGEVARNYRSPYGSNGTPSILNRTIDDFIQIHDFIDSKRKESFEQFKKIIEQAKDKHVSYSIIFKIEKIHLIFRQQFVKQ